MAQAQKRKLWSPESMHEAVLCVKEGNESLREASRLYNVPLETLRRRVTGAVEMDCKPGPPTILTKEEEDKIYEYLIKMSDMGYGLTREIVMHLAYMVAEKLHKKHPFTGESAGRSWFDGFRRRHPKLTIRTPQALSYCRAISGNEETISDLFGKVGAIYGKLNLFSKPMQVFNADETGISIVHKPGKVLAQLGRRNIYSITAAERGKTHTVLACVSASGYVLPPMMIYPRKRAVPENMKIGAVPNTLFLSSENGWINSTIYLQWLQFFVQNIPPLRPVLLIQDGHASHISIEVIEFAQQNGIHMLCLPAHTTHILQPLDVGVFKSFKSMFSKACTSYISKHPGRVITADILASLVAEAWPLSFTALNIMSGFKKCGLFPLNPSTVDDRRLAPSRAFRFRSESESTNESSHDDQPEDEPENECEDPPPSNEDPPLLAEDPLPSTEALPLSTKDMPPSTEDPPPSTEDPPPSTEDPPPSTEDPPPSTENEVDTDSSEMTRSSSLSVAPPSTRYSSSSSYSDVLSDILVLPAPSVPKRKRKAAINKKATCITDMLEELKEKERKKTEEKEMIAERKREREEKKIMKEKELEEKRQVREERKMQKKKEKEEQARERMEKKSKQEKEKKEKKKRNENGISIESALDKLTLSDVELSQEEATVCPKCGLLYEDGDEEVTWVCCDKCDRWFDWSCTKLRNKKKIPETFFCENCKC